MAIGNPSAKLKVFCSYAHEDEVMRDRLEQQLAALKRRNLISVWHDRDITAGTEWKKEIERELNDADLILLLISAAFLDSDFCASVELERAIKRHQDEEALVIPVMLKPCDVEGTPVAYLQQVPKDGKPITMWPNRDSAYLDAVKRIKAAIEKWSAGRPAKPPAIEGAEAHAVQPGPPAVHQPTTPLLRPSLASVFGRERYQTAQWLQTGLERAYAIARIEREAGMAIGTGFLISAEGFSPSTPDAPLLVTCSYVISPGEDVGPLGGVPYSTVVVNFELAGVQRRVKSVIWSSSMVSLRTIVVQLDEPVPGVRPCPVRTTPYLVDTTEPQGVAIIGHPGGRSLAFSLRNSAALAANDSYIHYRANTEPGSIGSPVFEWDSWQVIAVHSARRRDMPRLDRVGTYEACEGVSIRAILNAARAGR